jgi:ribose 5-phosphate isomerase B
VVAVRIALAGDHAGYQLKLEIAQYLRDAGHEPVDFGPNSEDACDLPDHVYPGGAGRRVG